MKIYRDAGLYRPLDSLPTALARVLLVLMYLLLLVPVSLFGVVFVLAAMKDDFKDTWDTLRLPPWPKKDR